MRCALVPISNSVLRDFFRFRVSERRVRPLCHLLFVRQQTWEGIVIFAVVAGLQLIAHMDPIGPDKRDYRKLAFRRLATIKDTFSNRIYSLTGFETVSSFIFSSQQ